jgi:hypothetical protein
MAWLEPTRLVLPFSVSCFRAVAALRLNFATARKHEKYTKPLFAGMVNSKIVSAEVA